MASKKGDKNMINILEHYSVIINLVSEFVNSPTMELIYFLLEILVEVKTGRFIKRALLRNIKKAKIDK